MIIAIKIGDRDAYSQLYSAYYSKLCKYVYSLSTNYKQAEDIVQDMLIEFWEKHEKLNIVTSLNNYLYRSAFNRYVNQNKKNLRGLTLIDELRLEAIIELEELEAQNKETRLLALENVIEKLPPKRRDIFILSKLKNYKYKEIAAMKDISVSTVESQIRKAMISIREEMLRLRLEGIIPSIIILVCTLMFLAL